MPLKVRRRWLGFGNEIVLTFHPTIILLQCFFFHRNLLLAFATGTAAELVPIARLATGSEEESFDVSFPHGQKLPGGPVTTALLTLLREVMVGEKSSKGTEGWLRDPFSPPEEFCK